MMEENNNFNDNSNNKKNGLVLPLIGSLIIIICLVGYICYDKMVNPSSKNYEMITEQSNKKKVAKQNLALDDKSFINLYNKFKDFGYTSTRLDNTNFSGKEYLTIVGDDFQKENFIKTDEKSEYGNYYTLDANIVSNILKKYFGSDFEFNKQSIVSNFCLIKFDNELGNMLSIISYDENTNLYKINFGGYGSTSGPSAQINNQVITKATKSNDEIIVESKSIYIAGQDYDPSAEIHYSIYSDVSKTNLIDNLTYKYDEANSKTISVDNYLDKASTITYKFKLDKKTNNYYFVNSSIRQ